MSADIEPLQRGMPGSGPKAERLTLPFDQGVWLHFPIAVGSGAGVTITIDHRRVVLGDDDLASSSELVELGVLKPQAELLGDDLSDLLHRHRSRSWAQSIPRRQ